MEKHTVLVVEDDALIRMAIIDMVVDMGFASLEADNGPAALALLSGNDAIDILLTDLGLPGMSGHQLVVEARRLRSALKVVVASGYAFDSLRQGDGVTHLYKPFDIAQLRRALQG